MIREEMAMVWFLMRGEGHGQTDRMTNIMLILIKIQEVGVRGEQIITVKGRAKWTIEGKGDTRRHQTGIVGPKIAVEGDEFPGVGKQDSSFQILLVLAIDNKCFCGNMLRNS